MHTCTHTHAHAHIHTHMQNTEAVVLYHYEKQQDKILSLEMGDVITNVEQVCAGLLLPQGYHT